MVVRVVVREKKGGEGGSVFSDAGSSIVSELSQQLFPYSSTETPVSQRSKGSLARDARDAREMAAKMEALMEAKDAEIAAKNVEIAAKNASILAAFAAVGADVGPSVGAGGDVGASAGSSGAGVPQSGVDAGGVASGGVAVGVGVDAPVGVGVLRVVGGASGAPPTNNPTTVPEVHASV